jgi:hypothetical protein
VRDASTNLDCCASCKAGLGARCCSSSHQVGAERGCRAKCGVCSADASQLVSGCAAGVLCRLGSNVPVPVYVAPASIQTRLHCCLPCVVMCFRWIWGTIHSVCGVQRLMKTGTPLACTTTCWCQRCPVALGTPTRLTTMMASTTTTTGHPSWVREGRRKHLPQMWLA